MSSAESQKEAIRTTRQAQEGIAAARHFVADKYETIQASKLLDPETLTAKEMLHNSNLMRNYLEDVGRRGRGQLTDEDKAFNEALDKVDDFLEGQVVPEKVTPQLRRLAETVGVEDIADLEVDDLASAIQTRRAQLQPKRPEFLTTEDDWMRDPQFAAIKPVMGALRELKDVMPKVLQLAEDAGVKPVTLDDPMLTYFPREYQTSAGAYRLRADRRMLDADDQFNIGRRPHMKRLAGGSARLQEMSVDDKFAGQFDPGVWGRTDPFKDNPEEVDKLWRKFVDAYKIPSTGPGDAYDVSNEYYKLFQTITRRSKADVDAGIPMFVMNPAASAQKRLESAFLAHAQARGVRRLIQKVVTPHERPELARIKRESEFVFGKNMPSIQAMKQEAAVLARQGNTEAAEALQEKIGVQLEAVEQGRLAALARLEARAQLWASSTGRPVDDYYLNKSLLREAGQGGGPDAGRAVGAGPSPAGAPPATGGTPVEPAPPTGGTPAPPPAAAAPSPPPGAHQGLVDRWVEADRLDTEARQLSTQGLHDEAAGLESASQQLQDEIYGEVRQAVTADETIAGADDGLKNVVVDDTVEAVVNGDERPLIEIGRESLEQWKTRTPSAVDKLGDVAKDIAEEPVKAKLDEVADTATRTAAAPADVIDDAARRVKDFMAADPDGGDNPAVRFTFERGHVIGHLSDGGAAKRWAQGPNKNMGELVSIDPVQPGDQVHPLFLTGKLSPDHPRRVRYEHRQKLKEQLPKKLQGLVTHAMKKTQKQFLDDHEKQFADILKATGLGARDFWRQVRQGPPSAKVLAETKAVSEAWVRGGPLAGRRTKKGGIVDKPEATPPKAPAQPAAKALKGPGNLSVKEQAEWDALNLDQWSHKSLMKQIRVARSARVEGRTPKDAVRDYLENMFDNQEAADFATFEELFESAKQGAHDWTRDFFGDDWRKLTHAATDDQLDKLLDIESGWGWAIMSTSPAKGFKEFKDLFAKVKAAAEPPSGFSGSAPIPLKTVDDPIVRKRQKAVERGFTGRVETALKKHKVPTKKAAVRVQDDKSMKVLPRVASEKDIPAVQYPNGVVVHAAECWQKERRNSLSVAVPSFEN
jgi:hypothetical protein